MVRPCVARRFRRVIGVSGLASMYPAFDWSAGSGPSWISARVRSHYRTGLNWAIRVTSVRMRREDRTSISSHPLADLGGAGNSITRERLRGSLKLVRLEGSTMSKNAPRDARELVGKGDSEHVAMQPLLCGLDPRPEPVAFPSGRFHFYKNDPCCLHEQDAQVAIAPLRYFAEDGAVPGRDLPRNQP